MRLRLVTVTILLAMASRGDGRPRHPDPLDSSNSSRQEANVGSPDSRYMMTLMSSPTSSHRRDISITSVKFDSSSNKSNWLRRSMLPSSNFGDNSRKNYLPLGALSSATSSKNGLNVRSKKNCQSTASNNRNPMMIPFISPPELSTPKPISVSITTQRGRKTSLREERNSNTLSLPLLIPIPVAIPVKSKVLAKNIPPRVERKMASRNLVKIIPQRLKPNNYYRRNFTNKPVVTVTDTSVVDLNLKNWPNEVVQNVEDLFNYEKYTSFFDDRNDDNNKISTEVIKLPNNHESIIKSPGIQEIQWSKIPVVAATSSTIEDVQINSNTNINKINVQQLPSTQIGQNTVVHIMNTGSRKPNVTVVESMASLTPNRTKTGSTRPPQNVHIMFMSDKDSNQTSGKPMKPVEITGSDSDCPTIMINSITQINNTIESKEGCTDLNIVIKSHVLNTQVFKPGSNVQNVPLGNSPDGVKEPYGQISDNLSNNYQINLPLNDYHTNSNNYENNDKAPENQPQSDTETSEFSEPGTQVSTLEVFQNTQINVGGNGFQSDIPNNVDDFGSTTADDSAGTNIAGSSLTDSTEGTMDITETQGSTGAQNDPVATGSSESAVVSSDITQTLLEPAVAVGELGSPQSNDAPGVISLPNLPNIPNIPRPGQVSNIAGNLGGSSGGGVGSNADDEDDFDLLEAISPLNLLDSISSVFDSFSGLNPLNYGILGMAMAPFVAFAAGIVGVAAFIFPWAFPESFDVARNWDNTNTHIRIFKVNPTIRDIVHSSIHDYKHLNEQDQHREVKDIHSMDQSLRTVATQLLNTTTKREDLIRISEDQIMSVDSPMSIVHISTQIGNVNTDIKKGDDNIGKMKFGIPVNSKFGHLELSNPGQAMAMTDEEIEKEMATATAATRQKFPTTTSMLSTWIQLYPPSTTTDKTLSEEKISSQNTKIQISNSTKSVPVKSTTIKTNNIRKAETKATTKFVEKTTEVSTASPKVTKTMTTTTTNSVNVSTTPSAALVENDVEETVMADKKSQTQRITPSLSTTTKSTSVTKKPPKSTTLMSNSTTHKNQTSKPSKTNSPNRIKPFSTRRPHKNDTVISTSKIEKVTIKPSTTAAPNIVEHTDKPSFITKIKASVLTNTQKPTTPTVTMKSVNSILSKSNFTNVGNSETKIPTPTKVNNALKVHLKKPTDDTTKIEIQPIRVNPPVLIIEKIEDGSSDQNIDSEDKDILENSKIDLKFEFDPKVSTVQVQTQSADITLPTSPTMTTKKPRTSNKRKRNKNRRRKTTTTSTTTTVATATKPTEDDDTAAPDSLDLEDLLLSEIQSKIEPESKTPPKNKKQNQQTQVQKPIGTQIYNFLSREVMPSVGVMSLVGLGLGLASYFLYPFGGGITRRNYEVEPNYKYNLDEYGDNYGLSEEEVLSKVYSGMTSNQNHDSKYSKIGVVGEKNSNYYKYSALEQPQQQPTRYPMPTLKTQQNRVAYRPVETTSYDVNYRNTEFKYPDVPTTPNYYERQRQQQQSTDFVPSIGKVAVGNNRQFVVGNIPKEYSSSETDKLLDMFPIEVKTDSTPQYQVDKAFPNHDMPISPMPVPENLKDIHSEALIGKIDNMQSAASYDDLEMNPSAVAIEHGPRVLKSFIRGKRGIIPDLLSIKMSGFLTPRKERSSAIQVIPSKSQIEKERKEEEQDLSNEILNIIDEALPLEADKQKKRNDYKDQMKKHQTMDSDQPLKILIKSDTTSTTAVPKQMTTKSASSTSMKTTITTGAAASEKAEVKETAPTITTTTSTTEITTEAETVDQEPTTIENEEIITTTAIPPAKPFDIFAVARKIAEVKLRLGLTILKHASEGFARYIGTIQKKFHGDE
ncbi:uncharacterized protein LOC131674226 [Phymastichus coffea]|uniref:uncharacterized protein LOC131674226 n=1 Tax=Phymastichus coffea TaxID=108790 RepID=UPI00273B84FB|nr:uncharacterized protein LOC131674226 [Phymastichus coffea]